MPAPQGNQYAKGNKGGGRKSSYRPEYAEQARRLCEIGLTEEQLARFFGIAERTINRWKNEHEEFLSAVQAGKALADNAVERAVLHGITGYYVEVRETNAKGQIHTMEKWIPGSPGAGLRWLSLRRPEQWREKK
jgi:transcriptional regulator with XRE-family HTH domain